MRHNLIFFIGILCVLVFVPRVFARVSMSVQLKLNDAWDYCEAAIEEDQEDILHQGFIAEAYIGFQEKCNVEHFAKLILDDVETYKMEEAEDIVRDCDEEYGNRETRSQFMDCLEPLSKFVNLIGGPCREAFGSLSNERYACERALHRLIRESVLESETQKVLVEQVYVNASDEKVYNAFNFVVSGFLMSCLMVALVKNI